MIQSRWDLGMRRELSSVDRTIQVMGLDTVDLVMAIEEEFGIEIPNTDAPNLAVLGDMHDYIVRAAAAAR
jgi:acyl carrier protein